MQVESTSASPKLEILRSSDKALKEGRGAGDEEKRDRLEISEEARSRAKGTANREEELAAAKGAMLALPPLNAEQAMNILKRIERGDYSQHEVIKQYASRVARDVLVSTFSRHSYVA